MSDVIPTFILGDVPASDSFTQTGKSLRLGYVLRQESLFITNILLDRQANPGDPTIEFELFSEKAWEGMRSNWAQDAEAVYPEEGDYLVWIIDPSTGDPVPLGSMVEFIGGEVRENPEALPCIECIWDLTAVDTHAPTGPVDPSTYIVTLIYINCYGVEITVEDIIDNLGPYFEFCAQSISTLSGGTFTTGDFCDLTYRLCTHYFWDLTGVPVLDPVTIDYIDCDKVVQSITGPAGSAITDYCGEKGSFTVDAGTLAIVETCPGGIPIIY